MDADILRTQLRKTLGSTRGFKLEDDDDERQQASATSSDDDNDDDDDDDGLSSSSSSEEESPRSSPPPRAARLEALERSDSLGEQIKSRSAQKPREASSLHVKQTPPDAFKDDADEEDEGEKEEEDSHAHEIDLGVSDSHAHEIDLGVSSDHEEDEASAPSPVHERRIAGERSPSGDDAEDGKDVSHASVLDAWSRQIESTMGHRAPKPKRRNRIGSNDFGDDDYYDDDEDDDDAGAFDVKYSKAHAVPANAEPPATPPDASGADDFVPGAQSREDLENLGKTFIRIKAETGAWLDRVLRTSIFSEGGHVDATDTSTLFEALKSGVVLCRVANAILPGCIPTFTTDFSKEASYMVPLSERENIKKFIRACHDAMSIPDSLLFEVGDLHNQQNIPKVVLSLRAVAEYARKFLGSAPDVHWRKLDHVALAEDEDAVLMSSAEMSKLDSATVFHMYAAESAANEGGASAHAETSPEEANFENRKRSIKKNLVLSTLVQQQQQQQQQVQSASSPWESADSAVSSGRQRTPKTVSNLSHPGSDAPSIAGAAAGGASSSNSVVSQAESVEAWLAALGMSSYLPAFVDEGWDELPTVALMTESDLRDVGIRKKGHLRKLASAVRQLKARGSGSGSEQNSPTSAGLRGKGHIGSPPGSPERSNLRRMAGSPRGGVAAAPNMAALGTRGLHAMDRRELFNKELAWAQCRSRANVTMDLEDARAIWTHLHEVRARTTKSELADSLPVDAKRAVGQLVSLTEDLVRSLMPFEAPIVIDIGWDSLKCGYVFSKAPVMIPCVVGKYSFPQTSGGGASTKLRARMPISACSGRNVFDQCQAAYGPGASDRSRQISGLGTDEGTFVVRRAIHRGIDSIVDPQIVEWDDMEKLIEHMYRDVLQADAEQHPILVIEPCRRWGGAERQRMADMLTSKFNAPAIYFSPAAPLVAYKASLKSCVVLDLGESRSTASVVYNNRLVKDAVVNSPIGGLQLTELMMQSLTQDGYDFKSVFEAQNPARFSSTRHFLEQEMAREVKDRVCVVSNTYEEFCVSPESLPAYLGDYLPRVSHGAPFLNVGEARAHVPEALFSPDLVRRDQFYNGGSLQHIIKAALDRCTESVAAAASETVLICGGMGNLPGLAGRLQKELNEIYALESRKPPRVMLASDDDVDEVVGNPLFTAWQGGSMLALQHDFQTRWIAREVVQEKGEKAFTESSVAEGLGPFPLYSPDTALYKANRAVNSLKDLISILGDGRPAAAATSAPSGLPAVASRRSSVSSSSSSTSGGAPNRVVTESDGSEGVLDDDLSPRSLKSMIEDVATFLDQQKCPEVFILDVKMHLYDRYSRQPPRKRLPVEEILLSLSGELRDRLEKYVSLKNLERNARARQTPKSPGGQRLASSPRSPGTNSFSEFQARRDGDDSDEDDDNEEEELFAMAI